MKKTRTILPFFFLLLVFSCDSPQEVHLPVNCEQKSSNEELILTRNILDSSLSLMAPRSWKTEFNFNQESSSVFSSDTSKDLDQCLIVSKIDFYFPNTEVAEFYQICLSYLRKEKHIELLDSGIFSLNDSPIHWIKYSDPNDTLCAKNTNLELFYFGTPGIKNFKIKVHGEEKIEERLCEGYQLFLANQ